VPVRLKINILPSHYSQQSVPNNRNKTGDELSKHNIVYRELSDTFNIDIWNVNFYVVKFYIFSFFKQQLILISYYSEAEYFSKNAEVWISNVNRKSRWQMVIESYRDFQEYILDDNSWIVCQSITYLFSPKGLQDYFSV